MSRLAMTYIPCMKTLLVSLSVAAAVLPAHVLAARVQDPQQVMAVDLNACPRPVYPAAALAQRAGGKTTVEVQIGEQGRVTDARVFASSGRADLDAAAIASLRHCLFHAVLATGQAPTGWLKTQYVWVPGEAQKTQSLDAALLASTRKLAEAGDPVAQNRLGSWYQNGTHVKADPVQAAAWYLLAAQAGNAIAQNNLGVLYHRGLGVPADQKQAVHWYAKAAEQGHGWAQANLSWAYQHGTAGERDMDQALHWLTRSAEGGLAAAQLRLGMLGMHDAGSDQDRAAAAAWIARAAAQGDAAGQYYLGRTFELGQGNAQDDVQAAAWYRKALGRSEGRAEVALGKLLAAGRVQTADAGEAAELFQKAMQSRQPDAYHQYGLILEQNGDLDLARAVYLLGANMGHCHAAVRYVELRSVQGAADHNDVRIGQQAQWCKGMPEAPPRL
ncbi:MAG: TonB family protein [Lysobacteraceae bacterium]|nr:MAG: TonB family protein [Xanthomonadaceae bacterium]